MIDIYRVIMSYHQDETAPHNRDEALEILSQHGLKPNSPEVIRMMKMIEKTVKTASMNDNLLKSIAKKTGWPLALLTAVSMLMPQQAHANPAHGEEAPEIKAERGIDKNFQLPESMVQKVKIIPQWVINAVGMDGFSKVVRSSMMTSLKDDAILLALDKVPQNMWADSLTDIAMRRLQSHDLVEIVNKFMKANKVDSSKMQMAIKSAVLEKLPDIKKAQHDAVQRLSERTPLAIAPAKVSTT